MCIRYHIEFWLPVSNEKPDWERRVKRGLVQSGTNGNSRLIPFYECNGRFLLHATCPRNEIRDGGYYRNRIEDFCYQDNDCFVRLAELQSACTAAKREAEAMDAEREAPVLNMASRAAGNRLMTIGCRRKRITAIVLAGGRGHSYSRI